MSVGPRFVSSGADFRMIAKGRLPRLLFDYIDGGSFAEETLAQNGADLARVSLRQRVLRDVSKTTQPAYRDIADAEAFSRAELCR